MQKITIKQTRSAIGRDPRVRATLKSLGLGKIGQSRIVVLNAATRGMVSRVQHLLHIEGTL